MHLLTAECADIYRRRLAPSGVLALHISNRALDLDPVARGMARYLGWSAVQINSRDDPATGESSSRWVLLTSNQDFLEKAGLAQPCVGMEQTRANHLDRRLRESVARAQILTAAALLLQQRTQRGQRHRAFLQRRVVELLELKGRPFALLVLLRVSSQPRQPMKYIGSWQDDNCARWNLPVASSFSWNVSLIIKSSACCSVMPMVCSRISRIALAMDRSSCFIMVKPQLRAVVHEAFVRHHLLRVQGPAFHVRSVSVNAASTRRDFGSRRLRTGTARNGRAWPHEW
jgi:hypothetical protein